MSTTNILKLFAGKSFHIPKYQRYYAWELSNINDLFQDIQDSIQLHTGHYIGTFILAKEAESYAVVDGQQRLTTITMILFHIINNLKDKNDKSYYERCYIKEGNKFKLTLLGDNEAFLKALMNSEEVKYNNRSQRLLFEGFFHIKSRIEDISKNNEDKLKQYLEKLVNLEVMELIETDQGNAIRIFQTVNDRGLMLSNIERVKSIIYYYSDKFLAGKYNDSINDKFGNIFNYFSEAKEVAERNKYANFSQKNFDEDTILRYHYLAFPYPGFVFRAGEDFVLPSFIKPTLSKFVTNSVVDETGLEDFIKNYVEDLTNFFKSFLDLMMDSEKKENYYILFSFLEISLAFMPLTIRLKEMSILDSSIPDNNEMTFLDLLQNIDLRVYKFGSSSATRDIYTLANTAKKMSQQQIQNSLLWFGLNFHSDWSIDSDFNQFPADSRQGLKYVFIMHSNRIKKYNYFELTELKNSQLQLEHIFPQACSISFPSRGFIDIEDYNKEVHTLGNLTFLEGSLNASCSNKSPEQKVQDGAYNKSKINSTKEISSRILNNNYQFTKEDINKRTKEIIEFIKSNWPLWKPKN